MYLRRFNSLKKQSFSCFFIKKHNIFINKSNTNRSLYTSHIKFNKNDVEVIELNLPKFHDDMQAGKLLNWYVKEGDHVTEGDLLADIETHLAIIEYKAPRDGYIAALLAIESDEKLIEIDHEIALIVRKEQDIEAAKKAYYNKSTEEEKFKPE